MVINLKKVSLMLAIRSDELLVNWTFFTHYILPYSVSLSSRFETLCNIFFKTLFSHFLYKGDKNEYKKIRGIYICSQKNIIP